MQLESQKRSGGRRLKGVAILAGALVLAVLCLGLFRAGGAPAVEITPELPAIGPRTPVTVTVAETGRGLTGVRVALVQGERMVELADEAYTPRPPLAFWGARTTRDVLELEVGRETVEDLREGEATLRVEAARAPSWLRHPEPVVAALTLPVDLTPPSLSLLSTQHYVSQGGSGVVVYRLGEGAVRDGVEAGERFFPGHPLPGGGPQERFALFAAPYDLADGTAIRLMAEDGVGNVAQSLFVDRFFPKPVEQGTIRLSEEFMGRVVPEILSRTPQLEDQGELLANYVHINSRLRRDNRARLAELAADSRETFLWSGAFLQMPNAQVMSPFAVERTYVFDGEEVDREHHLGFDLASVRRDEVPAANAGTVVLAEYFGIYGNAVILDHGYGLMSLYGHLSSHDVTAGESVERGQTLGRTGATGLAGGDHLHFAMLVGGLPVNPLEWWDAAWVRDRVERKLEAARVEPR